MTAFEQMLINFAMQTGQPLEQVMSGFVGAIKGGLQGVSNKPQPLGTFPYKEEDYLARPLAKVSTNQSPSFTPIASIKDLNKQGGYTVARK